jgi:ribonuclease HI
MHFDGSKLLGGLGAGVVLTSPKGDKLQYVLQMHFRASNNVAEYEALVHGLKMAKQIGIRRILCFGDSDLVTHQVSGNWDARDANMASYRFYVQQLSGFFEGCEFHHVPRANNDEADRLSKIGSTKQNIPAGVSLEIIRKPSIKPSPESPSIFVPGDPAPAQVPPPDLGAAASGLKEVAGQPSVANSTKDKGTAGSMPAPPTGQSDEAGTTTDPGAADPLVTSVFHIREIPFWAEPFSNYLITRDLPQDEAEARRIQRHAGAYTIINSELYKRSVSGIFQKCIEPEEGIELLRKIHQGEC